MGCGIRRMGWLCVRSPGFGELRIPTAHLDSTACSPAPFICCTRISMDGYLNTQPFSLAISQIIGTSTLPTPLILNSNWLGVGSALGGLPLWAFQGLPWLPQAFTMPVTCHSRYRCGYTPTLSPGSRHNGGRGVSPTLAKHL